MHTFNINHLRASNFRRLQYGLDVVLYQGGRGSNPLSRTNVFHGYLVLGRATMIQSALGGPLTYLI